MEARSGASEHLELRLRARKPLCDALQRLQDASAMKELTPALIWLLAGSVWACFPLVEYRYELAGAFMHYTKQCSCSRGWRECGGTSKKRS